MKPKKKTLQKTKKKKKNLGGRPTRYKAEYTEQARKLCLLGYIDRDLADFFGIAVSTLNKWKIDHPKFMESIKSGKDIADIEVVESLFSKTKEKTIKIKKPMTVSDGGNMGSHVEYHENEVHVPADTTSIIFWLKNRQPAKWRDKQDVELSGSVTTKNTFQIVDKDGNEVSSEAPSTDK